MKFKKIAKDYFKVILDRLFRLKPANVRYERVFSDILNKFLIKENNEAHKNTFNLKEKIELVEEIFNNSFDKKIDSTFLSDYIKKEEERIFKHNELSDTYLNANLNLEAAFLAIKDEPDLKENLVQILKLIENKEKSPKALREEFKLLYPIEKIILCEGATEEELLGEFAKLLGYDFSKYGVYVIGAGGKNQVARLYYKMVEEFNLPIFILLDSDANSTCEVISPKLRKKDKLYKIKSGEFEDILDKNLIADVLNEWHKNDLPCGVLDFLNCEKTSKRLYEVFKEKGFGDFKKAEFAKVLKEYLEKKYILPQQKFPPTGEIVEIIKEIQTL